MEETPAVEGPGVGDAAAPASEYLIVENEQAVEAEPALTTAAPIDGDVAVGDDQASEPAPSRDEIGGDGPTAADAPDPPLDSGPAGTQSPKTYILTGRCNHKVINCVMLVEQYGLVRVC
jgi:hypothetical protein